MQLPAQSTFLTQDGAGPRRKINKKQFSLINPSQQFPNFFGQIHDCTQITVRCHFIPRFSTQAMTSKV